uniref:TmcB/TmcC TPR repeats domain-containing protein n=1 Tax=Oryza meridionalis TaxID=40149 RepID=A0A0E0DG17_9ORYZ
MLLRSSSTPFLHSFLSPSSAAASPSSLQLRRAFSDGHLPSLHPSSDGGGGGKNNTAGLHTELSFSIYNTFNKMAPPPVQEQDDVVEQEEAEQQQQQAPGQPELPLFLARGLGIDRIASGLFTAGGGGGKGGAGRMSAVEEEHAEKVAALDAQYKRMMDEQPGDALFLRNYAQFLHEVKGDARRAEEYYSRAMLADPTDGEIMSQYAKLVWEVHRDQDRSLTYFHKSVQAAPHNSNVLAAYASFLWEQDDDDDDDLEEGEQDAGAVQPGHVRQLASVAV